MSNLNETFTYQFNDNKSSFQCIKCKSIMRFDASFLSNDYSRISLDNNDLLFINNTLTIPAIVTVVSHVPFCPYCKNQLVIIHSTLLERFNNYLNHHQEKGTVPAPTISTFLDHVFEVYDSATRSKIL